METVQTVGRCMRKIAWPSFSLFQDNEILSHSRDHRDFMANLSYLEKLNDDQINEGALRFLDTTR